MWNVVSYSQTGLKARWDSEYYDPVYLKIEEELERVGCIKLADVATDIRCGPFGTAIHKEDYRDSGVPVIRVADTSGPFINKSDDLIFIDRKLARELARHIVKPGDIVVSQRGTIAQFAMVTDEYEEWVMSANLIGILHSKKADFGYLLAFLNSHFGLSQMMRLQSGQVQPKIVTDDVKSIRVYLPSQEIQKAVGDLMRRSYRLLQRSKVLYAEAEALLLAELGLDDLDLSHQPTYTQDFRQVWSAGRLDAEYFQPKYQRVLNAISLSAERRGWLIRCIGQISEPLKYGTSTKLEYLQEGVPFLRIADVRRNRFSLDSIQYISETQARQEQQARVKTGDVLISRSGTLGLAVAIPEYLDNAIFGSYFIRVRPDSRQVIPEYLALFVNSPAGRAQVDRLNTGAIQTNLTIPAIESIQVPVLPLNVQEIIVQKVLDSFVAEDEAHRLLEEAKRRVEAMILEENG